MKLDRIIHRNDIGTCLFILYDHPFSIRHSLTWKTVSDIDMIVIPEVSLFKFENIDF